VKPGSGGSTAKGAFGQPGAGACPIRFRCAGCDHFRTDVSYLPDLTAYLDDLLRTRERLPSSPPSKTPATCTSPKAAATTPPPPPRPRSGQKLTFTEHAGALLTCPPARHGHGSYQGNRGCKSRLPKNSSQHA
jgi:hypothetical protein